MDRRRPTDVAPIPVGPRRASGRARILDIRQTSEFPAGHLPGAAHIELGDLADTAADPGPPRRNQPW